MFSIPEALHGLPPYVNKECVIGAAEMSLLDGRASLPGIACDVSYSAEAVTWMAPSRSAVAVE